MFFKKNYIQISGDEFNENEKTISGLLGLSKITNSYGEIQSIYLKRFILITIILIILLCKITRKK